MSKSKNSSNNSFASESGRRSVTAHEVARFAGVSQSAVSRTFTEGASVSDETRLKVNTAAAKLGYRPNLVARSLITGRSKTIGVTIPSLSNPFYAVMLETLSSSLAQEGYRVLLFTSHTDEASDPVLDEVLRYRVDALVLISSNLSSHFADECQQIGLPVVLLNRKTDSESVSSVTGQNQKGAKTVGAFLVAGRHRRFAFMAGSEISSTSRDREKGFFEYLKSNGFKAPMRVVGNYSVEGAVHATRELLSGAVVPDAIFCANDLMALTAINVARAEFNLKVGQDISIVGFDDTGLAGWPVFGLTSYSQPIQAMVDKAVSIIMEFFNNRQMLAKQEIIPGQLIVRDSARIPKAGISIVGDKRIWMPFF